jgi:PHD/YefM family antitoxin component YafN of YafNO toxin-antitoxin module
MPKKKRKPQLVIENGEPTAVIIDISEYERMLERLEEADDLAVLEEMRKRPLSFRPLKEFLAEYDPRV